MASASGGSATSARQILSHIAEQIGDLSQALSNDTSSVNTATENVGRSGNVEEEVRSGFSGYFQSSNPTSSAATASAATSARVQNDVSAPIVQRISPAPSLQHQRGSISTPVYNVRRNFSNQRNGTTRSINRRPSRTTRSQTRSRKGAAGPFIRDLILLAGPNDGHIPRQGTKVLLQEHGHVINAFEFMKEWSDVEIILQIQAAFQEKLPNGVDFEIVHSVHTSLIPPTLAAGQSLTGSVLCRIFRDNKPIYVRPAVQILKEAPTRIEKHQDTENVYEDDDDSLMTSSLNVVSVTPLGKYQFLHALCSII